MSAKFSRAFLACSSVVFAISAMSVGNANAASPARERLLREAVAVQKPDGKTYVSWRLLPDDPADVAFNVYRKAGEELKKLNERPIEKTTDFTDASTAKGEKAAYVVRAVDAAGREGSASDVAMALPADKPYKVIPFQGKYAADRIAFADLDGDGRLDFVIKQPANSIDPYEKYWKPSPDTYKLEAYSNDGRFLWRYDLGRSIEMGIWYSPYIAWDLDGDGRAEVIVKTGEGDPRDKDGRVQTGPEYVTVLDGMTGKELAKAPWPDRKLFEPKKFNYNMSSRNQLGIAYLDGKHPSVIVARGTYGRMIADAYNFRNGKLEKLWRWDNVDLPKNCRGQGAHWMQCCDLNGDGCDKIVLGSVVLNPAGKLFWTVGLGHPDSIYIGHLDPKRQGLQMYYNVETRQPKNGMCMLDAATGKILWGYDKYTEHVHSHGLCSDIDPTHPGCECYGAESHDHKFIYGLTHSAQGEIIANENLCSFGPWVAFWDADPQRELIIGRDILKYHGPKIGRFDGRYLATADLFGDWREEIVTTVPGELRIYTTTIPAVSRKTCLMADPLYRNNMIHASMGYYQCPMSVTDRPQ